MLFEVYETLLVFLYLLVFFPLDFYSSFFQVLTHSFAISIWLLSTLSELFFILEFRLVSFLFFLVICWGMLYSSLVESTFSFTSLRISVIAALKSSGSFNTLFISNLHLVDFLVFSYVCVCVSECIPFL